MKELTAAEMLEVNGAGGKNDPGGYRGAVPLAMHVDKASPVLFGMPAGGPGGDSPTLCGGRNLPGGYGD